MIIRVSKCKMEEWSFHSNLYLIQGNVYVNKNSCKQIKNSNICQLKCPLSPLRYTKLFAEWCCMYFVIKNFIMFFFPIFILYILRIHINWKALQSKKVIYLNQKKNVLFNTSSKKLFTSQYLNIVCVCVKKVIQNKSASSSIRNCSNDVASIKTDFYYT